MNTINRAAALLAIAGCYCVAAGARPAFRPAVSIEANSANQTTAVESITGRITAVAGNTFTIEVSSSDQQAKKYLTITIDQDTVVHGKIAVGVQADVTFRRADRNNIAVSIRTSAG